MNASLFSSLCCSPEERVVEQSWTLFDLLVCRGGEVKSRSTVERVTVHPSKEEYFYLITFVIGDRIKLPLVILKTFEVNEA